MAEGVVEGDEVALGEAGVLDLGEQVLVSAWEEPDECSVVGRAGFAGVSGDFGLDAVVQSGGQARVWGEALFDEVAGDEGSGGAEAGPDVAEADALELSRRIVMVEHGEGLGLRFGAGAGLGVDHDDGG